MADNELKIKITATDDASPAVRAAVEKLSASMEKLSQTQLSLNQRSNETADAHDKLNTGSINLAAAFTLVKGGAELAMHAFEAVEAQLHRAIEEALQAEKVQNQLTGALVNTGNYTAKTAKEIEHYVETTEHMTGINGEAIKSMIAMGVQMGLTVGQAEKLEEASRKLAAQAGISTEEAFSKLKMTLSGASRGVAQYIPQIKELGEAQLKSGAAIEFVNKALDASYAIYQNSLPAAIQRAESAVNNVYKAFGLIITQNPLAIKAVALFAETMEKVASAVEEAGKFITEHQSILENVIVAVAKTVAVLVSGAGLAGAFSLAGTAAAALTAVSLPMIAAIGAASIAVVALGAAFYKWPGLFDMIIGVFKDLVGEFYEGLAGITKYTAMVVGIFDNDLKKSLDGVTENLMKQSQGWNDSGKASMEAGIASNKASEMSTEGLKKDTKAQEDNLTAISNRNKEAQNTSLIYAGYDIGTEKQRQALDEKVANLDKEKKAFETYLNDEMRLAVDKETEQNAVLLGMKAKQADAAAKAMSGTGGAQEKIVVSNAAVAAEQKKQADLEVERQKGTLNEEAYQAAMLASQQRSDTAKLEAALAHKQAMADILGDSEEGYAAKQALAQTRHELEMQQMLTNAANEGANVDQINAIKLQQEEQYQAQKNLISQQNTEAEIKRNELLGNNFAVSMGKIELEQKKHGAVMGAIRGVQQTEEFKGVQQGLSDLGSLRNSHSKKAFEVGKAAALAQAGMNTFLAATAAYSSLAGIPLVGPVLGAAAAAAAIAAGVVNMQKISSQKFEGGQGDEGMDTVPQALTGKSFVVSGGERVVQPSANRDLKAFLNRENQHAQSSGGGSSTANNITLHYNGGGGEQDAQKMADIVIEQIRSRSERGSVIMNNKGLTG